MLFLFSKDLNYATSIYYGVLMKGYNWIEWQFYPNSTVIPKKLADVVSVFVNNQQKIATRTNHTLSSNQILDLIMADLMQLGFTVEAGKLAKDRIRVPVLFGKNGIPAKSFDVDAYDTIDKIVVEVEAGRGVTNYQFLKDFFEALVMIDVEYLVIAVRKVYRGGHKDFETVTKFFDILYSSRRFIPAFKGLLIIGY